MPARVCNVTELINAKPVSVFQWRVVTLCFIAAMLDGFDTQVIAFVAPVISRDYDIPALEMGVVFSYGFIGLMLGSLTLSVAADRIGRKPVILLSCLIMGVFTLLTASAQSLFEFQIYRFLTGIGLGGVIPNLNALTAEFAPMRRRALMMTMMFSGFSVGAVVGGFVSAPLISAYGWQTVFIAGGLAPILLTLVLAFWLPESILFRLSRNEYDPEVGRCLKLIDPSFEAKVGQEYVIDTSKTHEPTGSPIELLKGGIGLVTLGFWATCFLSLGITYSFLSWLPFLMTEAGLALDNAIYSSAFFNLGAIVGGLALGFLIDKYRLFSVLPFVYVGTIVSSIALGTAGENTVLLFSLVFLAGLTIGSAQYLINAIVVSFYPTSLRSTGLGWTLAAGRLGTILAPIAVGVLLTVSGEANTIFFWLAGPAAVCIVISGLTMVKMVSIAKLAMSE